MRSCLPSRRVLVVLLALALGTLQGFCAGNPQAQPAAGQPPIRFGGAYSGLDARRQQLVKDWVARFSEVIGRQLEPGPFYDEQITLSPEDDLRRHHLRADDDNAHRRVGHEARRRTVA